MPYDPNILVRPKLFAEHHFILEEICMCALDYPGTDAHIGAYDRFREELETMIETDPSVYEAQQVSLSDCLYK